MKKGGKGGKNTKTGAIFEEKRDLAKFLSAIPGYKIDKDDVYYNSEKIARIFKKHGLYKFLDEKSINWKEIISRQLLPDDGIYVLVKNTLFIIECKFQNKPGSVDEKLQTCDFKKKQYQKLFKPANIDIQYFYILSNWFKQSKYKDVLEYINSVGCHYCFEIPLIEFGLPDPRPHTKD